MTDQSKNSFLERLKKTRSPDSNDTSTGAGSFTSKFAAQGKKPPESPADLKEKFAKDIASAVPFEQQKNVQRSKKDDAGYAETVRKKRSDCVFLVRGKDRGKAAWHYVLVDKAKKEMFLAAARGGSLDVADYGEVLYSGWGQDPPPEIKQKIDDEYN
jgi:hypothetical protein